MNIQSSQNLVKNCSNVLEITPTKRSHFARINGGNVVVNNNILKYDRLAQAELRTYQKCLLPGEVGHVIEILVNKAMHCG